ncbi:Dolichyl-diphosphooligosaccharide--protein glycosyltransferase subunit WBP1 [Polychytrium aggregatum]|uniref:Dolichyl-diphosphooligosaccharide--protein glycosyltransferase subunit WBP1 n=1 Tax=Polychytrium aggregatum TaxID=110093 RepID=UPI0022FE62E4|nr:Dolichyl-diphosphooligosaccharide--protein glycosyltransferase subunit WBP1 [Polychytrium aggregatum]KAI9207209.1 Dolichyl-diphosphooligosaccharide--protein glycosyltransferase subunit WBP1 [Polychytrium aggregatum]
MKSLSTILVLLLSAVCLALAKSSQGSRALVLLNDLAEAPAYSQFLKSLQDRGFTLTVKAGADKDVRLVSHEERVVDHVVILSPKISTYGGDITVGSLIDFVSRGGNILAVSSAAQSEFLRDFGIEFSVDYDDSQTRVIDHFNFANQDAQHTLVAASRLVSSAAIVPSLSAPVLFRGVGHRLNGKNPLIVPVLTGYPGQTYSWDLNANSELDPKTVVAGEEVVLASALQARDNARVVFVGSSDLFTDELISSPVQVGDKTYAKSGNLEFITELSKWAFAEKSVLRIKKSKHHREGETEQHGIYRIKDQMIYRVDISEYRDDVWQPFHASDVQFEALMLDPYVRVNMKETAVSHDPTVSRFTASFKLPDQYGVFTFKVDYRRHGYSWITASDVVEIRPYRHNQYPRFLSAALPYYVNAFSMILAFFLFAVVFLYNREPAGKAKQPGSAKAKAN